MFLFRYVSFLLSFHACDTDFEGRHVPPCCYESLLFLAFFFYFSPLFGGNAQHKDALACSISRTFNGRRVSINMLNHDRSINVRAATSDEYAGTCKARLREKCREGIKCKGQGTRDKVCVSSRVSKKLVYPIT